MFVTINSEQHNIIDDGWLMILEQTAIKSMSLSLGNEHLHNSVHISYVIFHQTTKRNSFGKGGNGIKSTK